jgi:hypothetical protein
LAAGLVSKSPLPMSFVFGSLEDHNVRFNQG